MRKIIITGGSGFIGTKITESLIQKNYLIHILDITEPRIKDPRVTYKICNVSLDVNPKEIENAYGIINLAGRNIGQRWNSQIKKDIYDSRINSTRNLVNAIKATEHKPSVLISASAVGYYGDTKDKLITEDEKPGNDYLSKVAADWENEANKAPSLGLRTALVRTANVIGKGGLVATLEKIFKKHLGGYFGDGNQYMPWVSAEDIVSVYVFLLETPKANGAYNTSAGEPLTQKEFMKIYAETFGYWPVIKIPGFAAKLALGEFAKNLSAGQKISSKKLIDLGFKYKYKKLGEALRFE